MDTSRDNAKKETSRRSVLKLLWIGLGLAAMAELIMVIISFFRPATREKAAMSSYRMIDAGSTDSYKPGMVTAFVQGQFYLVCIKNGGFLAVSSKCTHLGCALPWDETEQKFICPCHASKFDILGNVLSSPAPRALDLFAVNIVNDKIEVDISSRIQRNRFNINQVVYPEKVTILKETRQK